MLNFVLPLEATATSATGSKSMLPMILMMVALFAIMYFFTIRPQKKQQKKEQEMRDATQVGDEITTIGGIMGRVVTVKEDGIDDVVMEAYDELGRKSGPDREKYLGTGSGFSDLDNVITGLNKSDLLIVAARPAMCKTSFVLNIAANVCRHRTHK